MECTLSKIPHYIADWCPVFPPLVSFRNATINNLVFNEVWSMFCDACLVLDWSWCLKRSTTKLPHSLFFRFRESRDKGHVWEMWQKRRQIESLHLIQFLQLSGLAARHTYFNSQRNLHATQAENLTARKLLQFKTCFDKNSSIAVLMTTRWNNSSD